jgi:hypothetical protein
MSFSRSSAPHFLRFGLVENTSSLVATKHCGLELPYRPPKVVRVIVAPKGVDVGTGRAHGPVPPLTRE